MAADSARRAQGSIDAVFEALDTLDLDQLPDDAASELLVTLCHAADRLGGHIARVAAVVDASGAWRASGATSMAAWLSRTAGVGLGRARSLVELGEAMATCPVLDEAVRAGSMSPAAAAALIPAMSDDGFDEASTQLVAELAGKPPAQARRHVEQWRATAHPVDDTQRRRTAHDTRTLTFTPAGDGMTHIHGLLPNRIARNLRSALGHLAGQQRLDGTARSRTQRRVDALGDLAAAHLRGEITGGRNVPRIILTSHLDHHGHLGPTRDTFTGDLVPDAEVEQMCCDSIIHRYVAAQPDAPLRFGRGRRTATPHQWLAMVRRDGGCRHPACDRPPQWCEAHHLRPFATRGGLTDIDEMVLLCHHHHHALHDDGWTLTGTPDHLTFTAPHGNTIHSPLPRPDTTTLAA
jgi:hypothetical protein